jgi:hypothetical protein
VVTANTPRSLIFLTPRGIVESLSSSFLDYNYKLDLYLTLSDSIVTDPILTALITSRLKAADPTMVEGPSSPGISPNNDTVSITESRISGALEPKAINVKFAMVGFQMLTLNSFSLPI